MGVAVEGKSKTFKRRAGRYIRDGIYRDPTPPVRLWPARKTAEELESEKVYANRPKTDTERGGSGIAHASRGRVGSRKRRRKAKAKVYLSREKASKATV